MTHEQIMELIVDPRSWAVTAGLILLLLALVVLMLKSRSNADKEEYDPAKHYTCGQPRPVATKPVQPQDHHDHLDH